MDKKQPEPRDLEPKPKPIGDLKLSAIDQEWQDFDKRNLRMIARQREIPYLQFDGMSFSSQYYENEKIGLSYIYPKKNKAETPYTSGIGADKIKTLGSMVNGYHFEPNFTVKRKNEVLDDLSTLFTNWVRDSREKEKYDEKVRVQNRSLFEQGTAYTIEKYFSYTVADKKILSPYVDLAKLDKVSWVDNGVKSIDFCSCDHVRGTKVFLENLTLNDIDPQPRGYVVELAQYELLKEVFGQLENFQYVPRGNSSPRMLADMYGTINAYHPEFLQQDIPENEIVWTYDRINGRFQIYISTIPMLESGYPLKIVSPSGKLPIAKGDLNPSEDFWTSRGIPFEMKIDQQLYDLTFKIALIKMKQSAYTPSVNNTGKFMSSAIYEPSAMSEGFQAEKIQKLIDEPGIKQADFSFLQLIKDIINDKSINPVLEGQAGGSNTLGEYMDKTRKAMLKIGYVFDAIINWEKQKALLRLYNLISYGIRKKPDGTYADLSLTDSEDDGAAWNVQFQDHNYNTENDMFKKNLAAKDQGRNVKHAVISPMLLRSILEDPEITIECDIVPVDKNNDTMAQIKLVQNITQAQQIFGPNDIATQRLKRRYARVMGEKYDDFFKTKEELDLEMAQAQQQLAQQLQAGAANAANTPGGGNPSPVAPVAKAPDFQKSMVDGFYK